MNFIEIAEKLKKGLITVRDEQVKKCQALIAEMASTADGRQEIADVIATYFDLNFNKFDIAPYLFMYKNFALGDKPEFRLKKKGIKAYWIAPNSYTPKSRNYQEVLTMDFDTISVSPECLIDELKAGRVDTFADLLFDGQEAVRNAIIGKIFTVIAQAYNATSHPDFYHEDTTKLAQATLDDAIDAVAYKTGSRPVVIGDGMLINQITGFSGFAPEAVEEIRKTGKIGVYRGATILDLPEVLDPVTNVSLVPKNEIFVSGSKIGYAGTYGDTKSGQDSNIDDWTWFGKFDKEWGATVIEPMAKGLYRIKVI